MAEYDARTINIGAEYSFWKDYINAVKEGTFPGPENTYAISDDVIEKLY